MIIMTPRLRKFTLTAHVTSSVGWLGSVVAYLALAITGLRSGDAQMVGAAYIMMELIGWYVIIPFSLAALATGLVQARGTEWGLIRHYWILAKFLLSTIGTIILLVHMRTAVSPLARVAAEVAPLGADFRTPRLSLVVHAGGGLLILLTATVLSVYKPRGMTRYGWRKQNEQRALSKS